MVGVGALNATVVGGGENCRTEWSANGSGQTLQCRYHIASGRFPIGRAGTYFSACSDSRVEVENEAGLIR